MKKVYEQVDIQVVILPNEDVIRTSIEPDENELPSVSFGTLTSM